MIRRPPRSTPKPSSAASDVYKRQLKSTAEVDAFRLRDGSQAAWLAGETFGNEELRKRIEPWLTSLLQSELEVDCGLPAVDRYHAILGFREQR